MDRNPRARPGVFPGRPRRRAAALAVLVSLAAGCAQQGPLTRRQTMMGALKSNVAQLESEKDQLAREMAELRAENKRVQTEMAELEDRNGDLATRLDDARDVMSRQGLDDGRSSAPARSASDTDRPGSRRANPVRSQPKGRKTPFAQIPNERRSLDEDEGRDDLSPPSRPSKSRDDDLFPQTRLDDRSPWLPVARGDTPPRRQR